MITYIKDNIFNGLAKVSKDQKVVFPHVCNNQGFMGAGIALQIKQRWPLIYKIYKQDFTELGTVSFLDVETNLFIVNMVAQTLESKFRNLNYCALVECMQKISKKFNNNYEIHTVKFGAGLAGGNWNFIENLIEDIWTDRKVYIYTGISK